MGPVTGRSTSYTLAYAYGFSPGTGTTPAFTTTYGSTSAGTTAASGFLFRCAAGSTWSIFLLTLPMRVLLARMLVLLVGKRLMSK